MTLPEARFSTERHIRPSTYLSYPIYYELIPNRINTLDGYERDLTILLDTVDDDVDAPPKQIFRRQQMSQALSTIQPQFFSTLVKDTRFESQFVFYIDRYIYNQQSAPLHNVEDARQLISTGLFKNISWDNTWSDDDTWYRSSQMYIKHLKNDYDGQPYNTELDIVLKEREWRKIAYDLLNVSNILTTRGTGGITEIIEIPVISWTEIRSLIPDILTEEEYQNLAMHVNELIALTPRSATGQPGAFPIASHHVDFRRIRPINRATANRLSNEDVFGVTPETQTIETKLVSILEELQSTQNGVMKSTTVLAEEVSSIDQNSQSLVMYQQTLSELAQSIHANVTKVLSVVQ